MPAQETSTSQATLTNTPPEVADLPAPSPNAKHVEVDAPFVFRASDAPSAVPQAEVSSETLALSHVSSPAPLMTMAEPPPNPEPRKGVLGKVKGFFASIFK